MRSERLLHEAIAVHNLPANVKGVQSKLLRQCAVARQAPPNAYYKAFWLHKEDDMYCLVLSKKDGMFYVSRTTDVYGYDDIGPYDNARAAFVVLTLTNATPPRSNTHGKQD